MNFGSILVNYRIKIGEILKNFGKFYQSFNKSGCFLDETGKIGKILAIFDNFLSNLG